LFTGAAFLGRVNMHDSRFDGGISFQHTAFCGEAAFGGASVATFIDVDTTPPERHTGALIVADRTRVAGDPARWPLACPPP
jgi:hypothetical protein